MTELKFVDLFKYNERIDYEKLSKNIDGAILRIGYTGWGTAKDQADDELFK